MTNTQNILLKKIAIFYLSLFSVFFCFFTIFYWNVSHNNILAYINLMFAMLNLLWLPFIWSYDCDTIKKFVPLYCVMFLLAIFFNAIFLWNINKVTAMIWFFLIPVGAMVFRFYKLAMVANIIACILSILVFYSSFFLCHENLMKLSAVQAQAVDIVTIFLCFVVMFMFCLTISKIYGNETDVKEAEIHLPGKVNDSQPSENTNNEEAKQLTSDKYDKYNELFAKIEKYFKEKEPYKNTSFSILKLATYLNTNILYVSRAIKLNNYTNFNSFVNYYRINFVKKMLDKGDAHKYTMKYIYQSAGFNQQSTFNIVFKQFTGVTPTEYLIENKKN